MNVPAHSRHGLPAVRPVIVLALLQGPIGETIFAGLGALIFAGYIVFDTGAAVWQLADTCSSPARVACYRGAGNLQLTWQTNGASTWGSAPPLTMAQQHVCAACMLYWGPSGSASLRSCSHSLAVLRHSICALEASTNLHGLSICVATTTCADHSQPV